MEFEQKLQAIIKSNISNSEKMSQLKTLSKKRNIRSFDNSGLEAYILYLEIAKQAKRESDYINCIYWNCVVIIYNLIATPSDPNIPPGVIKQISIAVIKSEGIIVKAIFHNIFLKAYADFFSDIPADTDELVKITWNEIINK